jgi:HAE1 family hydrophobic/amphiphilic exporter-1
MEEHLLSPFTKKAMHEIAGAIIAITFLMAAVFFPVAFMSGPVGVFIDNLRWQLSFFQGSWH